MTTITNINNLNEKIKNLKKENDILILQIQKNQNNDNGAILLKNDETEKYIYLYYFNISIIISIIIVLFFINKTRNSYWYDYAKSMLKSKKSDINKFQKGVNELKYAYDKNKSFISQLRNNIGVSIDIGKNFIKNNLHF
jgi:hypothetical protein